MSRKAVLSGLVALLVGSPVGASVVEIWTETTVAFTALGRTEAAATATGLATLNTSSSSSAHLSTLTLPTLSYSGAVPVTDPLGAPFTSVIYSFRQRPGLLGGGGIGNISGAIGSTAGGLTPATLPMTGLVTFCIISGQLAPCVPQLNLPLGETTVSGFAGFGVGGILTLGGTGTVRISIVGAPYTVETVSVVDRTSNGAFDVFTARGFAHGPLSLTQSTAQTSGVLQIVTAGRIPSFLGETSDHSSGSISQTLIHVVPEPGRVLLFATGAVGLVLLGMRRARAA